MTRPGTRANVLIVFTAIAAYASTLDNYFIQDDFGVVWLLSQKPASYFPQWFVSTWMDRIWGFTPDEVRPFPAVSYQIAAIFGAAIPFANHAINIGFHAGTALLVSQVARHAAGAGLVGSTFAAIAFVLLPNQAETVAWITGRVDSMPAIFYVASFITFVRWRSGQGPRLYAWALLWCFVALFSKQTTITLGPALVLYDTLVGRRQMEATWSWVRPYLPFAVLTSGYLLLRYFLFGEVAREGNLTLEAIGVFAQDAADHLMRIVFGTETMRGIGTVGVAIAAVSFLTGWFVRAGRSDPVQPTTRAAIYFGIIWTFLGIVPTLVSTYSSPRHAYLASLGWTVVIGIAFDRLWEGRASRIARVSAAAGGAALLIAYSVELRRTVIEWNARAALSRKAVGDLERVANEVPEGTLIVAGMTPFVWGYSLPFAAGPPFTRSNLTDRVSIISPSLDHCCGVYLWEIYTRERLEAWHSRSDRPPVVALHWDFDSGRMTRLADANDPTLRQLIALLEASSDWVSLEANVSRLVNDFVAYHGGATRDDGFGESRARR